MVVLTIFAKRIIEEVARAISTSLALLAAAPTCPACPSCPAQNSSPADSGLLGLLQERCKAEVALSGFQAASALLLAAAFGLVAGVLLGQWFGAPKASVLPLRKASAFPAA